MSEGAGQESFFHAAYGKRAARRLHHSRGPNNFPSDPTWLSSKWSYNKRLISNKPFIIWPLRFFVSPLDPDGSEHFGLFLVSLCLVIFLYIYHCHIYHFIFEGCHVPNLFSISHIAGPYVSSQGLMAISAHLYSPHTAFLSRVLQLNCARCCWLRFPSVFLIHHVKKLEILNSVSL